MLVLVDWIRSLTVLLDFEYGMCISSCLFCCSVHQHFVCALIMHRLSRHGKFGGARLAGALANVLAWIKYGSLLVSLCLKASSSAGYTD
jgi:hypothetical protein